MRLCIVIVCLNLHSLQYLYIYQKKVLKKAMEAHKAEKKEWHDKRYADEDEEDFIFGEFEEWIVEPIEILD